ncbi:hypothetical protein HKD37_02G004440 [Glycine soja]
MHRSPTGNLVPLDLEIEATLRRNRAEKIRKLLQDRTDYSSSLVPQFFTSIARPEVQAHNINYPHSLIHLIHGNLFQGLPNEDPYAHFATFIEICNTVKIVGVPDEAIRLSLLSFSLAGEAKRWLHSFKGNSLKTWEEVTGCSICGEAHEIGQCIPIEENTQEIHYMGNQ